MLGLDERLRAEVVRDDRVLAHAAFTFSGVPRQHTFGALPVGVVSPALHQAPPLHCANPRRQLSAEIRRASSSFWLH